MANVRIGREREVTFVTASGSVEVRMVERSTRTLCDAARKLKARWFVAMDGWNDMENEPIWAVFDMRTARHHDPYPGEWCIGQPAKTFTSETPDAAVMWALARGDR